MLFDIIRFMSLFGFNGETEKARRIDTELVLILESELREPLIANALQNSTSIKSLLNSLAFVLHSHYPIRSHSYSLGDQILFGLDKDKTDCRLSATVMGLIMEYSGAFNEVALAYRPGDDIHIGVIGRRDDKCYFVDFINHSDYYRVIELSEEQVLQNKLFPITGSGIRALDRTMNR